MVSSCASDSVASGSILIHRPEVGPVRSRPGGCGRQTSPRLRNASYRASTNLAGGGITRNPRVSSRYWALVPKMEREIRPGWKLSGTAQARHLQGISADGASRTRTGDLLGAIQALFQLSYSPAGEAPGIGDSGPRIAVWGSGSFGRGRQRAGRKAVVRMREAGSGAWADPKSSHTASASPLRAKERRMAPIPSLREIVRGLRKRPPAGR